MPHSPHTTHRIFLLSPANCAGARAGMVLSERSDLALARQLRSSTGAPLGEVFTFLSGLYFRGKAAYARAFARPPDAGSDIAGKGALVITPGAGLRPLATPVNAEALRQFAGIAVDPANRRYRVPLEQSARGLADAIGAECQVVLLGSIASPKYVDVLAGIFGERLVFPLEFVGRGDMSRGGLMLRSVAAGQELAYGPIGGAERHGPRPPKLEPLNTR